VENKKKQDYKYILVGKLATGFLLENEGFERKWLKFFPNDLSVIQRRYRFFLELHNTKKIEATY
jgi:hypothetical protein